MRTLLCVVVVGVLLALAPSAASAAPKEIIDITAKKFEFNPSHIVLKKGVPAVLRIKTLDRRHGFKVPGLGLEAEIKPGATVELKITPDKTGTFPFACHLFCGSGHEDMTGEIVVE